MAWLTGYDYRKSITLSRASGAVSNYQMKLLLGESSGATGEDVDCGGYCLSTFNDLRFTKADGTTLLDYWIESISGTTPNQLATIWIEFDSIGTGATTFYMYYGKPDATSVSNGANTFRFFDDFPGSTLDTAVNWTLSAGDIAISDSHLTLTGTSGTRGTIVSKNAFSKSLRVRAKSQSSALTFSSQYILGLATSDLSEYILVYGITGEGNNKVNFQTKKTSDNVTAVTVPTLTDDNIFEVTWVTGLVKLNANDSNLSTTTTEVPTSDLGLYIREGVTAGVTTSFEYIFITNYETTEPTWGSWGAMEALAGITTETATATATFDGDSLRDSTSESAEATDTFGRNFEVERSISESAEATDSMEALHLVDSISESASASGLMEADDLIRKKIKFPNLQGKHLSLKFESATDGSFAIYYLRHKMFKTRELTSDQKHPNTQGSHIGLKLSNSGTDAFTLMYVSEKMQLVTT